MCAAPLCVRQSPASINNDLVNISVYSRCHRGRRSTFANLRRSLPKRCRALPGIAQGEAGAQMPVDNSDLPHNSYQFSVNSSKFSEEVIAGERFDKETERNAIGKRRDAKNDEKKKEKARNRDPDGEHPMSPCPFD